MTVKGWVFLTAKWATIIKKTLFVPLSPLVVRVLDWTCVGLLHKYTDLQQMFCT